LKTFIGAGRLRGLAMLIGCAFDWSVDVACDNENAVGLMSSEVEGSGMDDWLDPGSCANGAGLGKSESEIFSPSVFTSPVQTSSGPEIALARAI
jgi:hypothetical protein